MQSNRTDESGLWEPTASGRSTSLAVRHLSTTVGIRILDQLVSNESEAMADGDIPNSKDESMDELVSGAGVREYSHRAQGTIAAYNCTHERKFGLP
jgi:hypothetical protein